jgi:hypothetical protein
LIYRQTTDEITTRMDQLGHLTDRLLKAVPDYLAHYQLLQRVFNDQYIVKDQAITARPKETISAQSVQNPHDPESTYRNKDGDKVKGYSANITETCNEEGLNLKS